MEGTGLRRPQPAPACGRAVPGAGGVQHLARLLGRGRAMEAILGADDFDAEQAERYGWINRALPDADLDAFVARLARRIASFPADAVRSSRRDQIHGRRRFTQGWRSRPIRRCAWARTRAPLVDSSFHVPRLHLPLTRWSYRKLRGEALRNYAESM